MLRTAIAPKRQRKENGCWTLLRNLRILDPLLRCEAIPSPMRSFCFFLLKVQLEVVFPLLSEKYKLETVVKEPVIYMERPLKAASHTIHIEVPPNPFWASIGHLCYHSRFWLRVQYESRVSLGYLNQSFQNAVRDGIRYGLEQSLFGWNATGL